MPGLGGKAPGWPPVHHASGLPDSCQSAFDHSFDHPASRPAHFPDRISGIAAPHFNEKAAVIAEPFQRGEGGHEIDAALSEWYAFEFAGEIGAHGERVLDVDRHDMSYAPGEFVWHVVAPG